MTVVILLSGCEQPATNSSVPSSTASTASPSATTHATPSKAPQPRTPKATAEIYDPYAVDPSIATDVAAACNALDIGKEVFAAAGKTTLRGDSVVVSKEKYTCVFATGDIAARGPNWLAVSVFSSGGPAMYKTFKDQLASAGAKIEAVSVAGADSANWVPGQGGPGGKGIGNILVALSGEKLYQISGYFTDVPPGAEPDVDAYRAIAIKASS